MCRMCYPKHRVNFLCVCVFCFFFLLCNLGVVLSLLYIYCISIPGYDTPHITKPHRSTLRDWFCVTVGYRQNSILTNTFFFASMFRTNTTTTTKISFGANNNNDNDKSGNDDAYWCVSVAAA